MFSIFSAFSMFSTCSKLTPCAPIRDGRMERLLHPCLCHCQCQRWCHPLSNDVYMMYICWVWHDLEMIWWPWIGNVEVITNRQKDRISTWRLYPSGRRGWVKMYNWRAGIQRRPLWKESFYLKIAQLQVQGCRFHEPTRHRGPKCTIWHHH